MLTVVAVALVPLVIAFLVASYRDPVGVALPAYAVVLPFGQGIPTGLPGPFGSVSSLLGVVAGVALLAQLATSRRGVGTLPVTVPVWLAFLALTGASLAWSVAPMATVSGFAALASLILLFTLIALVRITSRELVRIEDGLLLGGVASATFGLVQLLVLGGLPTSDTGTARFGNELLGPNNQAAALLLPLAIVLGRILLRTRGGLLVNLSATALLLVGILMTGSRGGLVATGVAFAVLALATPRGRRAMVGVGAAALSLVVLVLLTNPGGIGERQTSKGASSSGRAEVWSIGVHACRTHCLSGSGWGTFSAVYAQERSQVPEARVLRNGTGYEAHNIWMLALIEVGLLGLVLVVTGLVLTSRSAWQLPPSLRGPPLAALCGTIVTGFLLSNFEYKYFWMVLIYVVLCQNSAPSTPSAGETTTENATLLAR